MQRSEAYDGAEVTVHSPGSEQDYPARVVTGTHNYVVVQYLDGNMSQVRYEDLTMGWSQHARNS